MNGVLRRGTEAWPISRHGPQGQRILQEIVIKSDEPTGPGVVHLTPDQALYVQSRLSHITTAFLHGHAEQVHNLGVERLPADHEQHLSHCGAKVWPISRNVDGHPPVLNEVVVECEDGAGGALLHLSPEQARYIHQRLSQISMDYLHENVWGGEDTRAQ